MPTGLRQQIGQEGEQAACDALIAKGFRCRERNFRMRGGEIDLIMEDGAHLVFVEVKRRRTLDYGAPEQAVTASKIRRMTKTALSYITRHQLTDRMIRFDVVTVDASGLRHIPDAFRVSGNYYL